MRTGGYSRSRLNCERGLPTFNSKRNDSLNRAQQLLALWQMNTQHFLSPCDQHAGALKPHIAQYASDLFCITGQRRERENSRDGGDETASGRGFSTQLTVLWVGERERDIVRRGWGGDSLNFLFSAVLRMANLLSSGGGGKERW